MDRTRMWIGVGIFVVGLIWTGQGLGWVEGSFMTGVTLWAMIGPLVAGAGVWVAMSSRSPDRGRGHDGSDRDGDGGHDA